MSIMYIKPGSISCNRIAIYLLGIWMVLAGCDKKPEPPDDPPVTEGRKALILNEGSYGNGNASLTLYNITTGEVHQDWFANSNSGQVLGDILESAMLIGERIFLVVNNSNKIVVVDRKDFRVQGTIALDQPRYILPVSEELAYISTMYHSKVYVINTRTLEIVHTIPMPYQNTEGLLLSGDYAYACSWDKANNKLYKIRTATHRIEDSITLAGYAPHSILRDRQERLWVFGGNKVYDITSSITVLQDNRAIRSYTFSPEAEIVKPVYNSRNDMLYFINVDYEYKTTQGIYKMHTEDTGVPATPIIAAGNFQYFYQITLDSLTQQLYIADPKGFIQNGDMLIYDLEGRLQQTIPTGLGPSKVLFL